jgi:hypothetical protein
MLEAFSPAAAPTINMTAKTDFAVHSFHINIDIGDAAIHLLVDDTTRPKPTVYSAVYVDGGLTGATTYQKTAGIIREIEEVYTPALGSHFDYVGPVADNVWLRFDAIIVTHFVCFQSKIAGSWP